MRDTRRTHPEASIIRVMRAVLTPEGYTLVPGQEFRATIERETPTALVMTSVYGATFTVPNDSVILFASA